ncbi:MAG: xylanase/chitin deacetylase [Firmicutes bacterium]|nr:xylanase/chitin deacetylase [Bacillota bacterium]
MKYRLICILVLALFVFSSCSLFNKSVPVSDTVPDINTGTDIGTETDADTDAGAGTDTGEPADGSGAGSVSVPDADVSALDSAEKSWYYVPKANGEPSGEPQDIINLINGYDAYYLGDTSRNVIYLTFDEGYENGYTARILDVLKANGVNAAFFVTRSYITGNPDLVRRMANEGHLVCNHSSTHPSMPLVAQSGKESFDKEVEDTEAAYTAVTGRTMDRFFRPPMGNYSELSLYYTKSLGYRTVFWSFAYRDWEVDNQPSQTDAINLLRERTHNGGIFLLHAVSKTNADVLDTVLKEWKDRGYEFGSLYELPDK